MGGYVCLASGGVARANRQLQACRAEFPLHVDVEAPYLNDPEHLLKSVQHALDDANDFSAHHLRLRLAKDSTKKDSAKAAEDIEENIAATLRLLPGTGAIHTYVTIS